MLACGPPAAPAPCSSALRLRRSLDPVAQQRARPRRRTSRGGTGWRTAGRSRPPRRTGRRRARPRSPAGARGAVVGPQRPVAHAVGVHEVEPLVLDARRTASCPRAPRRCSSPCGVRRAPAAARRRPGHSSSPGVSTPCSTPCSKSTCMPTQMPSTGRPPASRRPMISWPSDRAQPVDAGRERADARARRARRRPSPAARSAVSVTVRAGPLERAHGGADVARAVVEDDDVGASATQSDALGARARPVSRGSKATASRSARATALNCASTRWCGSRPDSTRTCRAIWAWKASVSKTCRVSEPR